jgi:hypothetical protein
MPQYVIRDLLGGRTYGIQVRSVGNEGAGKWSKIFELTVDGDNLAPAAPTNLNWGPSSTSFLATWDEVTTNSDGTPIQDLDGYEVTVYATGNTAIKAVYHVSVPRFDLSFEQNIAAFGSPKASLNIEVRAKDTSGHLSTPAVATAANAAPGPVTGLSVTAMQDGFSVSFTPPADSDLDHFDIWLSGVSGSGGNKAYSGKDIPAFAPTFTYTQQYIRVYAVDVFGTYSTYVETTGTARSSFAVDTTPPANVTNVAVTTDQDPGDATGGTSRITVSWTGVSDTDLQYYTVRYSTNTGGPWQYVNVPPDQTSTVLTNLAPNTPYYVAIKTEDFWGNTTGAWIAASTYPITTARDTTAPAAVTGLIVSPGLRSITASWDANTESDVVNGNGQYEIQIDISSSFVNQPNAPLSPQLVGGTVVSFTNLTSGTTYYVRARAIDASGNVGTWSTTQSAVPGEPPQTDLSDGLAPTSSPTPTVLSGIGALFVRWSGITNADAVTYEVHLSTTTGFTPTISTKVTEISGTSATIKSNASGVALSYGVTYFIKLIAKDRDGSAPAGAQGSGSILQVSNTDIIDGTITGVKITDTTITAAKIAANTITAAQIAANTITASQIAADTITASQIAASAITSSELAANSVIAGKIAADAITATNIVAGSITGDRLTAATITGDKIAANTIDAASIKANTTITQSLTVGSTLTVGTSGIVQSANYSAGSAGWRLANNSFELNQGTISASTLALQEGANIAPAEYCSFEFSSGYYTGKITPSTWSIDVATTKYGSQSLKATSAASTDYWLGATSSSYNIVVDPSTTYFYSFYAYCASNITVTPKVTDQSGASLTVTAGNFATGVNTWTRIYGTFTTGAGSSKIILGFNIPAATVYFDGIQLEKKIAGGTTPSYWRPSSITTIDGGTLTTGTIQSSSTVTVGGLTQPSWSLNLQGNMQVNDALVRGRLILGQSGDVNTDLQSMYIQSYNYGAGSTGFRLSADGTAEFNSVTVRGAVFASSGSFTGTVNATSGSFQGSVTATSGSFTGSIYAQGGTIGGWTINSNSLSGSGTISGGTISGSTVSGGNITSSTLSSNTISGGSITSTTVTSATITGSTLSTGAFGTQHVEVQGTAVNFYPANTSYSAGQIYASYQSGVGWGVGTDAGLYLVSPSNAVTMHLGSGGFLGVSASRAIIDCDVYLMPFAGSNLGKHTLSAGSVVVDGVSSSGTVFGGQFSNYSGGMTKVSGASNVLQFTWDGSGFAVYVDGSRQLRWSAGTAKTFVIDHPQDKDRYLVHACLEGPENGVYYRGTARVGDVVRLPGYFSDLVDEASATVQLTVVDGIANIGASRVKNGKFYIVGDDDIEVFWEVKAARRDVPAPIVEPNRNDIVVYGQGPYKYYRMRNDD